MAVIFVEFRELVQSVNDAVNADAGETLGLVLFGNVLEAAFFLGDNGGEQHQFAAEREFHDFVHNVFHAAAVDFAMTNRTVRDANAGKEQTEIIINFGDSGDGGTGVAAGGLLINRDGGRETGDRVHVGLVHHAEKHAGVAGEALHIAALTFGVDGIKSEAGLAGAGETGHHDQLIARNVHVEIFEIVLTRPADADVVVVKGGPDCGGRHFGGRHFGGRRRGGVGGVFVVVHRVCIIPDLVRKVTGASPSWLKIALEYASDCMPWKEYDKVIV